MNFLNRQMFAQAARMSRMHGVRSYSTTPSTAQGLAARAQNLGASILKVAERALGSYAEPVVYNLKVAGSLAKQVYIAEKLAPPSSFQQVASAYRQIWSQVSNPSFWTHSLPAGQWRTVLLYGVEALGIFSIGEIIGKRSLVGYKIKTSSEDAHHH